jgi:hypothetical protein
MLVQEKLNSVGSVVYVSIVLGAVLFIALTVKGISLGVVEFVLTPAELGLGAIVYDVKSSNETSVVSSILLYTFSIIRAHDPDGLVSDKLDNTPNPSEPIIFEISSLIAGVFVSNFESPIMSRLLIMSKNVGYFCISVSGIMFSSIYTFIRSTIHFRSSGNEFSAVIGLGAIIELGAVIGLGAIIELGAVIGLGAIIELGAVIGLGAIIELGAVIGLGAIIELGAIDTSSSSNSGSCVVSSFALMSLSYSACISNDTMESFFIFFISDIIYINIPSVTRIIIKLCVFIIINKYLNWYW